MLKLKWVLGAVAALAVTVNLGRAADDVYDLRGPAPVKGQTFVNKGTLKIKDADTTMKVAGQTVNLTINLVVTSEEESKVLAVDGRNVTKSQTKIIKERADVTANLGGNDMSHTEPTALEKETVISERDGKTWKHSLVDTKPNEKQKKELDSRNGIENDDDLYPAEKVKVGHTWKVDAAALTKMLGNSFSDVKGKLDQKFVKVETVDGEECAVVESTGKLTAKMKDDGEPTIDVEMELKVATYKSLKTGVNVKEKFDGKISLEGVQKMDDIKVDIKMSGPISGDSTTSLKK
ncbi:hypothetical protein GobsT_11590 [Gemmata obscuriglobus]|uniref:Uncharacterized protein n=1 Tax=Gemmata obscuriglobus TaxID=114 RepID=A0A2Z3H0R1_9BACT|nr:hypothetical protein [Gemmata obscuriglobus]AWM40359.1 hypothetical protein C1280_27390 [Gemmata obscuriglobus]QEG26420.1 hypothetical protein GobsT_11590 [Gemmata obscuriglobus]VTS01549.1 unnamed protein product [Gemmata obscuriglobus UQM 2246]